MGEERRGRGLGYWGRQCDRCMQLHFEQLLLAVQARQVSSYLVLVG